MPATTDIYFKDLFKLDLADRETKIRPMFPNIKLRAAPIMWAELMLFSGYRPTSIEPNPLSPSSKNPRLDSLSLARHLQYINAPNDIVRPNSIKERFMGRWSDEQTSLEPYRLHSVLPRSLIVLLTKL